jgi:DNA polymerase
MPNVLTRDYETFSATNLKTTGADKYARHPSTNVFCLAVKYGNDNPHIWVNPDMLKLMPKEHGLPLFRLDQLNLQQSLADTSESHNDGFEQAIDEHIMQPQYKVPTFPLTMRRCSAAQAATNALPRDLETLSTALGFKEGEGKSKEGHALMLKMCKPLPMYAKDWKQLEEEFGLVKIYQRARATYKAATASKGQTYTQFVADQWREIEQLGYNPHLWLKWHHNTPEGSQDLVRLCRYCLQDVEAEYRVSNAMPRMTDEEQRLWLLDQTINRRGVRIDVEGAQAAIKMVADYKGEMESELSRTTIGEITKVSQNKKLKEWCSRRGVELPNTAKDTVAYFLRDIEMPDDVRRALEIRATCGQTSVTKYDAMLRAADEELQRVRGWAMYCGASTGRWTAKLLQLHNMPRGTIKLKTDEAISAAYQAMKCGYKEVQALYGDVMELAASAVRGCIIAAPGKDFLVSDFKSIEARVLAWLASEQRALQVFIDGLDTYKVAAKGIFGTPYDDISDDQRQVGKCSELALGFGGGIGAYASMARNYNIDLETLPAIVLPGASGYEIKMGEAIATSYLKDLEKRIKLKQEQGVGKASFLDRMSLDAATACDIIKQRWRSSRPGACEFWKQLESAAFAAIQNPGQVFSAGAHITLGVHEDFLLMKLPSGRCLRYYKPKIQMKKKFDAAAPTITFMRTVESRWLSSSTYGGKLCENAVQAVANDLLRHGMFTVEAAGYPVVMHVHDEVVTEVAQDFGSQEELDTLMAQTPAWADGLPVAAEGWRGRRYRKD